MHPRKETPQDGAHPGTPVMTPAIVYGARYTAQRAARGQFAGIPPARLRSVFLPPTMTVTGTLLREAGREMSQRHQMTCLQAEARALVQRLNRLAQAERWSQRRTAGMIGIPISSWRKLQSLADADPSFWMPALRGAVARLQA